MFYLYLSTFHMESKEEEEGKRNDRPSRETNRDRLRDASA